MRVIRKLCLLLFYLAEMATHGKMSSFDPNKEHCDFGDTLDLMIRNRLVCGINDTRIQRRLLQEPNLTYKEAFKTAQAMEIAPREFQDITHQQHLNIKPIAVHRLDKIGRSPTMVAATIKCFRYGGNHYANKCNFQERTCIACGKKGHLAECAETAREF